MTDNGDNPNPYQFPRELTKVKAPKRLPREVQAGLLMSAGGALVAIMTGFKAFSFSIPYSFVSPRDVGDEQLAVVLAAVAIVSAVTSCLLALISLKKAATRSTK